MRAMDERSSRLVGLDSLRGFAGLSVLAYHFLREYGLTFHEGDFQTWMDRYGHYGVEIFFIISGFVMFLTLSRSPSLRHFLAARAARLAPAFYCCLAITTLVLISHPLDQLPAPSPLKFAANLTMAPELFGQEAMDWSYWTLGYEFVFYAMIGAVFLCGAMKRIDWFCLGWLLMSALLQFTLPHIPHRVGEVLLMGYGQFFIIGIALCRFHRDEATPLTGAVLILAIATSLFGADWRAPTPGWLYAVVTVILTGVAWLAITGRVPAVIRVPLALVATVSFPLFLVHQFVGYHIIAELRANGQSLERSIAVATACSLVLAVMIYRFVELPARPRIKRWLSPKTQRPALVVQAAAVSTPIAPLVEAPVLMSIQQAE